MRRHGSVYIAVLGVSMIVITMAVGGIVAGRIQARDSNSTSDAVDARLAAQAGLELARVWINQDRNWRTNRANGTWASNLAIGGATVSIGVTDPIDGDLTNRPHDPVLITATGQKGQAVRILTQTLTANPTPLPTLQYAVHVGGQLRVRAGKRLMVGTGTISTNADLRNDSTVEGNADVSWVSAPGIVFGAVNSGSTGKAMPDSTVPEAYAKLGTLIVTPSTIDGYVLSPGVNPWGTPNPDGVYVIRSSGNVIIRDTRVNGTLVVIVPPGKTVTIDGQVLFQPARPDYPALIITGNAIFQFTSASGMSEATLATNFNPAGAPYLGVTDLDVTDSYPSEIQGLVHIVGSLSITQPCTIRGGIIVESSISSSAFELSGATCQIAYNPSLYTNPPQFYTTQVKMVPLAGSVKQTVN